MRVDSISNSINISNIIILLLSIIKVKNFLQVISFLTK